jgi:hypothetical protein
MSRHVPQARGRGGTAIGVRSTGENLAHLHKIRSPIALRNCIIAR